MVFKITESRVIHLSHPSLTQERTLGSPIGQCLGRRVQVVQSSIPHKLEAVLHIGGSRLHQTIMVHGTPARLLRAKLLGKPKLSFEEAYTKVPELAIHEPGFWGY